MTIEHVGRVYGGVLYDEDGYLYFRTDDGDIYALGQGAVAVAVARIILYHPGSNLQFFDVTDSGLTAALAAAVSGDHVDLPGACVISGAHTVPGGVTLGARGGKARLTGTVTLGAGSGLRDLAVEVSGSGDQVGVIGPSSGEAFARACFISVTSTDASAVGFQVGDGDQVVWDCDIATNGDTTAHCVALTGSGSAYLHYTKFTHPASGTSYIEYSPGDEYYSDQGWSIVQPGSDIVALDGHDDVNRGTFGVLQLDMGDYDLSGSDTISWRVGSNGIAYIYTQWSDNGTDWNTDWIGSYAINSGGSFITLTRPRYGRYTRMVRYDGNTNPFFAWASVNNYIYRDVTGAVYVQACTGDTTGAIPLAGDRAAYDATDYPLLHTNDTDDLAASLHHTIGAGATQAAAGNHDHGTRTEDVLVAQGATAPAMKDSHIKDSITGAYLAELAAALTDDRTYTLQDEDMTLAALNLAQSWTAAQTFQMGDARVIIDPDTVTPIHMIRSAATGTYMQTTVYRTAAGAGGFIFRHARGTEGSPATLASGDDLMLIEGYGHDGSAFRQGAAIRFLTNGTIGTNDMPTDIRFLTRAAGAGSASTKMSLTGAGRLGIGTTTPASDIDVHDTDAVTNSITTIATLSHDSTGTPAAGFGGRLQMLLESSSISRQIAGAIDWIWSTATHTTRTAYMDFYLVVAATLTKLMTLYATHLDHTHIYGHMYQDDTGTTITVSATNTDYIVTGMSGGTVNQFTFQNSQELKCLVAGKYKVTWSCSFVCGSDNQEIEGAVGVNSTRVASTSAHAKVTTASADQCISGTGILTLAVNDLVQIVVRNETSTANIIVDHANLTLDWVGP